MRCCGAVTPRFSSTSLVSLLTRLDQYWQAIQRDHQTVLDYFGRAFVPDTEFIILGHAMPEDGSATPPRPRQYLTVQERAVGHTLYRFPEGFRASAELQGAAATYIGRCMRMMKGGIALDHPDDLMINDAPEPFRKITLLDTNNLARFDEVLRSRNPTIFLDEFGLTPDAITTPDHLVTTIRGLVPAILQLGASKTKELQACDYPSLMDRLRPNWGDLEYPLREALRRIPRNVERLTPNLRDNPYLDHVLYSGLEGLVSIADRFAPDGQYPHAALQIMQQLGVQPADVPA